MTVWRLLQAIARIFTGTVERPSPSDIVPKGAIIYMSAMNTVEINLEKMKVGLAKPPKVWIPSVADTGSMDPVVDIEHQTILIAGSDEIDHSRLVDWLFQQEPGNIATYKSDGSQVLHRIVKKGIDALGGYLIFKGDNNSRADPVRVRREDITWLSIGVIY